jgi:hypothetical protein
LGGFNLLHGGAANITKLCANYVIFFTLLALKV